MIVVVEGEFILQAQTRELFEARRDTYQTCVDQSSATMMTVDVGVEGYLVKNAQIIAIDDQVRAKSVALQIIVLGVNFRSRLRTSQQAWTSSPANQWGGSEGNRCAERARF